MTTKPNLTELRKAVDKIQRVYGLPLEYEDGEWINGERTPQILEDFVVAINALPWLLEQAERAEKQPMGEPLATIDNAVSFSGVLESCDINGEAKYMRFRSYNCAYRIVFFVGDIADGLELGRSYFVEAEIMQTTGGTPFLKASVPPRLVQ